jgi:hypothetical protein
MDSCFRSISIRDRTNVKSCSVPNPCDSLRIVDFKNLKCGPKLFAEFELSSEASVYGFAGITADTDFGWWNGTKVAARVVPLHAIPGTTQFMRSMRSL